MWSKSFLPGAAVRALALLLLAAAAQARTVVDDLGRQVTVPRAPLRIVSLAPGATEMLFAAGRGSAGDRDRGVLGRAAGGPQGRPHRRCRRGRHGAPGGPAAGRGGGLARAAAIPRSARRSRGFGIPVYEQQVSRLSESRPNRAAPGRARPGPGDAARQAADATSRHGWRSSGAPTAGHPARRARACCCRSGTARSTASAGGS